MNSLDQMECLRQNMNDELKDDKISIIRKQHLNLLGNAKTSRQAATSKLNVTLFLIAAKVKQKGG